MNYVNIYFFGHQIYMLLTLRAICYIFKQLLFHFSFQPISFNILPSLKFPFNLNGGNTLLQGDHIDDFKGGEVLAFENILSFTSLLTASPC